jgi:hypothetical protein
VLVAACACTGTDVTVVGSGEGGQVLVTGANSPPVEVNIGKDGITGPPTPTPGPITPVYPVATPNPTATPLPK